MRSFSVLLIPAILIGQADLSDAARALIKKPQDGPADFTLRDGTRLSGSIVRITDRFVAIQNGDLRTCQNVDVSSIAGVKRNDPYDIGPVSTFFLLAMIAPLLPFLGVTEAIGRHDPKRGEWESTGEPHIALRFYYGEQHIGQGDVFRRIFSLRKGHYRFLNGTLSRRYDNGKETAVPIHFECDQLVVDTPIPNRFRPWGLADHARAPIVERWANIAKNRGPSALVLRADGTFEEHRFQDDEVQGDYKREHGGVKITWRQPAAAAEHWRIRTKNGALFLTDDGKTTEFKRPAPLD